MNFWASTSRTETPGILAVVGSRSGFASVFVSFRGKFGSERYGDARDCRGKGRRSCRSRVLLLRCVGIFVALQVWLVSVNFGRIVRAREKRGV
jgi:hypothetical protein